MLAQEVVPRHTQVMKLMAFICRYGHQPWGDLEHRSIVELREMSRAIAELLSQENSTTRMTND